jgi:hypothetical protein
MINSGGTESLDMRGRKEGEFVNTVKIRIDLGPTGSRVRSRHSRTYSEMAEGCPRSRKMDRRLADVADGRPRCRAEVSGAGRGPTCRTESGRRRRAWLQLVRCALRYARCPISDDEDDEEKKTRQG